MAAMQFNSFYDTYTYLEHLSEEARKYLMPMKNSYDVRNGCFIIKLPYAAEIYTKQQVFDFLCAHKKEVSKYCRLWCSNRKALMDKIEPFGYYSISYTVLNDAVIKVKFRLKLKDIIKERVYMEDVIKFPEDVEYIKERMVYCGYAEFAVLPDYQVEKLWKRYSDDFYCASWMDPDEDLICGGGGDFADWYDEEGRNLDL